MIEGSPRTMIIIFLVIMHVQFQLRMLFVTHKTYKYVALCVPSDALLMVKVVHCVRVRGMNTVH